MTTAPPAVIGPYRVLRPLARGGNAEVYVVEDPRSGDHLALKLLMTGGTARQRFDREYEAMIRLNHPNIVRVYAYGLHQPGGDAEDDVAMPWMTMELLGGNPVQAYARDMGKVGSARRLEQCVRVGADLARALDHIHRRGLVHRDLKSANVLVLPDGRVKLIDFGTAKVADAVEQITKANEFIGTFAYASPEQIQGKPFDHRADLYSLGVLLYRLFSGVLPFDSKDPQVVARMQITQAARPLHEFLKSLPEPIADVIMQLLSKIPEMRPNRGKEVADRLEQGFGRPLTPPASIDVNSAQVLGRDEAIVELREVLDEPRPGGISLIVGQSGSGREAVMGAVMADAKARGWPVFPINFGQNPSLDAIRFLRERCEGLEGAKTWADAVRSLDPSVAGPKVRDMLRAAGAPLLAEHAKAGHPVLVAAPDLHLAPVEASDLLVVWANGCARLGAAVIFVGGTSEGADDEGGRVRQAMPAARRVVLKPLDVLHTGLAVGAMLFRRPPPAAIARRIQVASGGQPLYVEDVVRRMVSDGLLKTQGRDGNRIEWAAREGLEVPIAQGARDAALDALATLPGDRRRIVEALALIGRDATVAEIAWYLDREQQDLGPALADQRLRELVAVEPDGEHVWVRWRQRLAEATVLEQVHPCRAGVIRRRIAGIVGVDTPITPAQIRTLVEVGQIGDAVLRARIWGETHLAREQPVTALEGMEPVISRADDAAVDKQELAWLYLLHAKALLEARPTDAQTGKSLARAQALGEGERFLAELKLLRARVQRVIGHYGNYRTFLMEAWQHVQNIQGRFDPAVASLGATIAQETSDNFLLSGDLTEATGWATESRAMALRAAAPHQHALADAAQAELLMARGKITEAERACSKLLRFVDQHEDADVLAKVLPPWSHALRLQGRWSEALERLDVSVPTYRSAESPSTYVRLLVTAAWCEIDLCRLGRAQELLDELFATLRRGEHLHLRLEADLVAGRIQLASGNLAEATSAFTSVQSRAIAAGLLPLAQHALALRAEVLWAQGEYAESERQFAAAIEPLLATSDVLTLVDACLARVRAMADSVNPNELLKPIQAFAEAEPAYVVRLEWLFGTARFQRASGQDASATIERAVGMLEKIAQRLDPTAQAALRVHPWSRQLRTGRTVEA